MMTPAEDRECKTLRWIQGKVGEEEGARRERDRMWWIYLIEDVLDLVDDRNKGLPKKPCVFVLVDTTL